MYNKTKAKKYAKPATGNFFVILIALYRTRFLHKSATYNRRVRIIAARALKPRRDSERTKVTLFRDAIGVINTAEYFLPS